MPTSWRCWKEPARRRAPRGPSASTCPSRTPRKTEDRLQTGLDWGIGNRSPILLQNYGGATSPPSERRGARVPLIQQTQVRRQLSRTGGQRSCGPVLRPRSKDSVTSSCTACQTTRATRGPSSATIRVTEPSMIRSTSIPSYALPARLLAWRKLLLERRRSTAGGYVSLLGSVPN